jgi:nucleoside 2-deoxyribosyltransferase
MNGGGGSKCKVYFAAPLFNDMERDFNLKIVSTIERYADVFLPQRDGGLIMELIKGGVRSDIAARTIFEIDRRAMEYADIMIAVLDGAKIDEGVAFEIGFMYGRGRPCIGLQTDLRRALPTGNNPMIEASLTAVCSTEQSLVATIIEYTRGQDLSCARKAADNNHGISGKWSSSLCPVGENTV